MLSGALVNCDETGPKSPSLTSKMRRVALKAARLRSNSLTTVPPPQTSSDYSTDYASIAASILYQSPLPSESGLPLYVLNAAAFPDAFETDYDALLPYVLARLPGEDELLSGAEYEVIFFAGGQPDGATSEKKTGPGLGWYLQAYHVLSRATRKRLQKLWVVHERSWVRVLIEVFGTIVSPKFKKKIVHVNTLSGLAMHLQIERVLIPPSVYLHDRRLVDDIYVPYSTGRRAFGADEALPRNYQGQRRLPRVLRETTTFLCLGDNLKQEGIFRVPTHSVLLTVLRESYDRGQNFIVWKEGDVSYVQPRMDKTALAQVHQADAYGVHAAASLIKVWYRELQTPIFPESCYDRLRKSFGTQEDISIDDLVTLISPQSSSSVLSETSRIILTWHLLPLLSKISSFEASNKMTMENLAICFAMALVRGTDQLQDAKMTSVIRRIVHRAIETWPNGLERACGATSEDFEAAIQPPPKAYHYEDPLHEAHRPSIDNEMPLDLHRIVLEDRDDDTTRPLLPPRSSSLPRKRTPPLPPRRKPAPQIATLPQYTALVDVESSPTTVSPASYEVPANAFTPDHSFAATTGVDDKERPHDVSNSFVPVKSEKYGALQTERIIIEGNKSEEPTRSASDSTYGSARSRAGSDAVKRKPVSTASVPTLADIQAKSAQLRSVSGESTTSNDDAVFVKPTWAASSRNVSASSTGSTGRPSPPLLVPKNSELVHEANGAPRYVPKPRAPSPGLLQRIASIEKELNDASSTLLPHATNQRKQSVDDIKRLYAERAGTVATLGNALRRQSGSGG